MIKEVICTVVCVGDEILYGQILNTNVQYLSDVLGSMGIKVLKHITIGDEWDEMTKAFIQAEAESDLVIITGGLGPTPDDLTKPVLAKMFDSEISLNPLALAEVKALFESRGRELNELNKLQAHLPERCEMISNRVGTAPGMWFERGGKVIISLPGVPFEVKVMLEEKLVPKIKAKFKTPVIYHKMIRTVGVPESKLAELIRDWEFSLPPNIKLAYLPNLGQVRLRLTAFGDDKKQLEAEVEKEIARVLPLIQKYAFGYDKEELEQVIGNLLRKHNLSIALAESCTGGFISHRLTMVAGSSAYFMGSIIPYHNEFKDKILGIKPETLHKFGAVSEECAKEMASNTRALFGASIGLASTGIAGPTGGSDEKPVGTIWIAMDDGKEVKTRLLQLTKDRSLNIQLTSTGVLYMLWRSLTEKNLV
jgi:nicotinamide-nucleotide amidase